ncbi:MAG: TlpA family protein disulfide reductase [bacterium]
MARTLAGVLVLVAILAAFVVLRGRRPAGENTASPPGPPPPPAQRSLPLAPDILITLYQGEEVLGAREVALSSLWERKPVVLNFWAGLCPPCRAEMPDFDRLFAARGDRFILIGVDIGPFIGLGSNEDGRALLQELKVTFPAGTTSDARTVRNYQILGMPTTVFITPQGRIFRKHAGLLTRDMMETLLDQLLAASRS